jgi:hypothetical protein
LVELLRNAPQSEAEARSQAAAFVELRAAAGSRAHVLKTFESGSRRALGETAAAHQLMIEALEANPFLAVAYKDVGDLFLQEYDMRRAWRCWEAARKIAPRHPTLSACAALEQRLSDEHPEYF